jgi:putative ABC transport system permease protein
MFKSYLKTAIRTLQKNRLTSFINLFGLGLSMSVGLMIMVRLQDALSYDSFHPSPEKTYRILSSYHKKNGEQWKMATTPLPLKDELNKDANVIDECVRIYPAFQGKAMGNGKEMYINGAFTEPGFFNVFGFTLSAGNAATALQQPNSVVISKAVAEKFFGVQNPVGKMVVFEKGGSFIITGVLNDAPGKSHLDFDAYASYASVAQMEKANMLPVKTPDAFAFDAAYTYVHLNKHVRAIALENELRTIASKLNGINQNGTTTFSIQRLDKITPGREVLAYDRSGSSWSKFYFEMGVALLILLAACFNYTNLTIARALTRAKEVGIRKIVGASRHQVFAQYLVESILLSLLALSFAWIILGLIIRFAPFNDDYEFIPSSFHYNSTLVFWSICYALLTGVFAGVSPAWILSAFKPLRVLKNLSTAKILGKVSLQKSLIVFQYTLSLTMIIFLFAFYRQFSFLSKTDPGFKRTNVVVLPIDGINSTIASQKVSGIAGVKSVAATSANFTKHFSGLTVPVWMNSNKEAINLQYYFADKNFIPSMEFSLVAGTNFPSETELDERYIVLNETATRALGFKNADAAIGQKLWINDSNRIEITGVIKDFQYKGAGQSIEPLAFRCKQNAYSYLYVTTNTNDKNKLITDLKNVWNELGGSQPFSLSWLDENLDKTNSQTATISLLGFLAFIAIAIASLGLLGLVVYTVEVKRKEISIRKIVGADARQLVNILSRGFINLLLIAGLIAVPIGFVMGKIFLQNFSERTSFGLVHIFSCFMLMFCIGLFTVISQTYKAAIENPVKNLRMD